MLVGIILLGVVGDFLAFQSGNTVTVLKIVISNAGEFILVIVQYAIAVHIKAVQVAVIVDVLVHIQIAVTVNIFAVVQNAVTVKVFIHQVKDPVSIDVFDRRVYFTAVGDTTACTVFSAGFFRSSKVRFIQVDCRVSDLLA